jgi:hypothetical protein
MSHAPTGVVRDALSQFPWRLEEPSPYRFVQRHGIVHLVRHPTGPPWDPLCGDRPLTVSRRTLVLERPPTGRPCVPCAISLRNAPHFIPGDHAS